MAPTPQSKLWTCRKQVICVSSVERPLLELSLSFLLQRGLVSLGPVSTTGSPECLMAPTQQERQTRCIFLTKSTSVIHGYSISQACSTGALAIVSYSDLGPRTCFAETKVILTSTESLKSLPLNSCHRHDSTTCWRGARDVGRVSNPLAGLPLWPWRRSSLFFFTLCCLFSLMPTFIFFQTTFQ
jgi:hypothetical protein